MTNERRYQRGSFDPDAVPAELDAAFAASPEARAAFEQLPTSHRREYLRWVREGRRDDTRQRRAAQAVMRLLAPKGAASAPGDEASD